MARTVRPNLISPGMAFKEWGISYPAFEQLVEKHGVRPRLEQGNNARFYCRKTVRPLVLAYTRELREKVRERLEDLGAVIEILELES
jgi:hypothetical protein